MNLREAIRAKAMELGADITHVTEEHVEYSKVVNGIPTQIAVYTFYAGLGGVPAFPFGDIREWSPMFGKVIMAEVNQVCRALYYATKQYSGLSVTRASKYSVYLQFIVGEVEV